MNGRAYRFVAAAYDRNDKGEPGFLHSTDLLLELQQDWGAEIINIGDDTEKNNRINMLVQFDDGSLLEVQRTHGDARYGAFSSFRVINQKG